MWVVRVANTRIVDDIEGKTLRVKSKDTVWEC